MIPGWLVWIWEEPGWFRFRFLRGIWSIPPTDDTQEGRLGAFTRQIIDPFCGGNNDSHRSSRLRCDDKHMTTEGLPLTVCAFFDHPMGRLPCVSGRLARLDGCLVSTRNVAHLLPAF